MLTFIDLFAGIGGLRLGFEQAFNSEMQTVFVSEWDKHAQKTYSANFADNFAISGDIQQINEVDIPPFDVCLAGFPCQPFSAIGKRAGFSHDTQGELFFEIVRILKARQPKAFLLENVTGIRTINKGEVFQIILEELDKLGYSVEVLELNSKDFGVPQKRKRLYFVGFLKSPNKFAFKPPKPHEIGIGQFIEKGAEGYTISESTINGYLFKKDDGKPEIVDENSTHPVKTLVSTYHKIQRLTGTFVRDNGTIRLLTANECKAIMGFPQDFVFPVSRTQMYRQLGNSVAVPVVREIARQMKEFLQNAEKS